MILLKRRLQFRNNPPTERLSELIERFISPSLFVSRFSSRITKRREKEIFRLKEKLARIQVEEKEIYVMLIGDYGGGSFKLLIQDIGRAKPNSPGSNILVGLMEALEDYENLQKAFGCMRVSFFFENPLREIQKTKNKKHQG